MFLNRLRYTAEELVDVLRDLTPDRRRARFGDIDFDWDYRVDTTASNVGLLTRLRAALVGSQYQPADPDVFAESMSLLPIDFSKYVFIDAGSGKGRALLMACGFPFQCVIGIERLPELHEIAVRNLRLLEQANSDSPLRKCRTAESWLGDAIEFPWPTEPTLLFLFNPFPAWVLQRFLERLEESLKRHPRSVWVVYHCPVLEDQLQSCSFLKKVTGTGLFVIYHNGFQEPD